MNIRTHSNIPVPLNEPPLGSVIVYHYPNIYKSAPLTFTRQFDGWCWPGITERYEWDRVSGFITEEGASILAIFMRDEI